MKRFKLNPKVALPHTGPIQYDEGMSDDLGAYIVEVGKGVRRVRTPEGARFFDAPIGTPITPGMVTAARAKKGKAKTDSMLRSQTTAGGRDPRVVAFLERQQAKKRNSDLNYNPDSTPTPTRSPKMDASRAAERKKRFDSDGREKVDAPSSSGPYTMSEMLSARAVEVLQAYRSARDFKGKESDDFASLIRYVGSAHESKFDRDSAIKVVENLLNEYGEGRARDILERIHRMLKNAK